MQQIVENHTHKSENYHEKGTLKMAQPRTIDKLSYPPGPGAIIISNLVALGGGYFAPQSKEDVPDSPNTAVNIDSFKMNS